MNTCVQIGLHDKAEGLFLTEPDWQEKLPTGTNVAAMSWDFLKSVKGDWQYYGIDTDPQSIFRLTTQHGFSEHHQFIQAHIDTDAKVVKGWHSLDYTVIPYGKQPHFSISHRLTDVLQLLAPITLLIVDIDCAEWRLFQDYDWAVKPNYVCCEVNLFDPRTYQYIFSASDFAKMFIAHGYSEFLPSAFTTSESRR